MGCMAAWEWAARPVFGESPVTASDLTPLIHHIIHYNPLHPPSESPSFTLSTDSLICNVRLLQRNIRSIGPHRAHQKPTRSPQWFTANAARAANSCELHKELFPFGVAGALVTMFQKHLRIEKRNKPRFAPLQQKPAGGGALSSHPSGPHGAKNPTIFFS